MSIYRNFQIVVTPALRDGGEEPVMQRVLEERFPGCSVEFGAPDSLHGRLAVYPTTAMKAAIVIDSKTGKPLAKEMPAANMLVAEALRDWGMWY